ncbi:MAG TPA: TauD/TfdA family dioxygenase [Stellaceae bacterium]
MMAITLALTRLGDALGIAAEGVDLGRPLDATTGAALRRALLDHLVLCIRSQVLAPAAYLAAMRGFGQPMVQVRLARHPDVPEVTILSSEDRDDAGDGGRVAVGAHWHSDDSYKAVPCSLTMLHAIVVPAVGGDTQFTNMYAAYDDLTETMKRRIGGLMVVHKYDSSRKGTRILTLKPGEAERLPEVAHPLVRTHPETGRKALYMNPNRMERIVGMERAASDALLDEITQHAIRPQYQYRHKWREGDILIWDNRCTMHKANADYPPGSRRLMHRIIVEGTVPV